jgi:integrase
MKREKGYRLFRANFRNRDGELQEASKWYIEFSDQWAKTRRLAAFDSKPASEELARNLVKLIDYYNASAGQTDPKLFGWLGTLQSGMRQKLIELGLINAERASLGKSLDEHLVEFQEALSHKGSSANHIDILSRRLKRIFKGCKFKNYSDIDSQKVTRYLTELQVPVKRDNPEEPKTDKISSQTYNFYLAALKQFCKWMVKHQRASSNPVDHLTRLNVRLDRRRDRRSLSIEELKKLLTTTASSVDRTRLNGEVRALVYRLAVETGLRANEIRTLTRASFDLDSEQPVVRVTAAYSKHRREDAIPLRPATAKALEIHLGRLLPRAQAFKLPVSRKAMTKMFRRDIEAAGIPHRDAENEVVDFHALRHTFVTNLARGGVHPKTAQSLARHSTISLTMDRYTHTVIEEQADALRVLPDLDLPLLSEALATGTDDVTSHKGHRSVLAGCLARSERKQEISVDSDGLKRSKHLESKKPRKLGKSAAILAPGSVCVAGASPGLQNQRAS